MKMSMTDIFTDIPIESLDEILTQKVSQDPSSNNRQPSHIYRRWYTAAALAIVCSLAGCAGYAVFTYPEVFQRYFEENEEKLSKELIQTEPTQAKNGDYCMKMEGVLSDEEVKRILISVTAQNDDSWLCLVTGETTFHLISAKTDSSLAASVSIEDCTEKEAKKGSYTKYYLCETKSSLTDFVAVLGHRDKIWGENSIETTEYYEQNGCLILPVKASPQSEKTITIIPKDTLFLQNIPLEKIEIKRLSITLSGTAAPLNAAQEKNKKQKPEIVAQTTEGKTICLLYDNTTPLTPKAAQADEFHRINLLESNHSTPISASGESIKYQASYLFVHALDIDQIQKIWINGTEYPMELN